MSLSIVVYFFITFLSLFIFIWTSVPPIYIVIVFSIKEALQFLFYFLNRDILLKKIDIKKTIMTILSVGAIASLSYLNMHQFDDVLHLGSTVYSEKFELVGVIQEALVSTIKVRAVDLQNILFNGLVSFVGFTVIMSFITTLSKRQRFLDFIFAIIGTFMVSLLFNFGASMDSMGGTYMLLLEVLFAYHIIMYHRRRYGVFFGMNTFVVWTLDSNLFYPLIAIAVATLMIYGVLNKPKISLFTVQLISPLIVVGTFSVYELSPVISSLLIIVTFIMYGLIIYIGSSKALDRINGVFIKIKYMFPAILMAVIIITGITLGATQDVDWYAMTFGTSSIVDSYGTSDVSKTFDFVQQIIVYATEVILIATVVKYSVTKAKPINSRIFMIISTTLLVFGYNFFMNIILHQTTGGEQFEHLRVIIYAPLFIVLIAWIRKVIYKRIEFYFTSGKRRTKKFNINFPKIRR